MLILILFSKDSGRSCTGKHISTFLVAVAGVYSVLEVIASIVFPIKNDYDGDDVCGVSFKDPNLVKIDSVMDVVFSVTVFLVCLWAIYSVTSFEPMKKFASGWKNTILGFSITYGVLLLIEN